MKNQYKVGTRFIRRNGISKRIETVVDVHTTKNLAGDIVGKFYVATHEMLGRQVTDYEVPSATIARSQILSS